LHISRDCRQLLRDRERAERALHAFMAFAGLNARLPVPIANWWRRHRAIAGAPT